MTIRRITPIALAATLLLLIGAPATAQEDGAQVYQETCAACHQADGSGIEGTFPPLRGNPNAADPAHVEDVIRNGLSGPLEVLGVTYDSSMPAQSQLSDTQIAAVVDYVTSIAGSGSAPAPTTTPAPTPSGDPARGEDLFLGRTRFTNGGPACVACHTAGTANHLGGAGLGPDLTDVLARFGGEAGLSGALGSLPFPTMQPVFGDRPLTQDEVADLTAFFASVATQQTSSGGIDLFWAIGLGGLVVLLAGMAIVFARPRIPYAQRLRSAR